MAFMSSKLGDLSMQDISIGDRAFYYTADQSVRGTFRSTCTLTPASDWLALLSDAGTTPNMLSNSWHVRSSFLKMEILILYNYKMPPNKILPSKVDVLYLKVYWCCCWWLLWCSLLMLEIAMYWLYWFCQTATAGGGNKGVASQQRTIQRPL